MVDLLISTLATLGYPVRQQGSFTENEAYPDAFFTFWNNSSDDGSHYDNNAIYYVWNFDVNFYSTSPAVVYEKLEAARVALREQGFIISGKGYSVASDEPTHIGRGFTALIIDHNTNDEVPDVPDQGGEELPVEDNNNQEG